MDANDIEVQAFRDAEFAKSGHPEVAAEWRHLSDLAKDHWRWWFNHERPSA